MRFPTVALVVKTAAVGSRFRVSGCSTSHAVAVLAGGFVGGLKLAHVITLPEVAVGSMPFGLSNQPHSLR